MKLIIDVEVKHKPKRPFDGEEATFVASSMHLESGNDSLEPGTIAKIRQDTGILMTIAEAIGDALLVQTSQAMLPRSIPHTRGQKDGQS